MIVFRPNTTFPLLKIARECGVDYAKVLRISEALQGNATLEANDPDVLVNIVVAAVIAENNRRAGMVQRP